MVIRKPEIVITQRAGNHMLRRTGLIVAVAWMMAIVGGASPASAAAPLHLGYSDWPGWVAWQVAIDKGWLTQAGLDVKFEWFDYSASMEAFAAGKIDGDCVTNGDALVMGAGGARNVTVMLTDFSNGNDMIVARPGLRTLK